MEVDESAADFRMRPGKGEYIVLEGKTKVGNVRANSGNEWQYHREKMIAIPRRQGVQYFGN